MLKEYEQNKYPDDSVRARIALNIGLTRQQVKCWFDKRRRKIKETNKKYFNKTTVEVLLKEYVKDKYPNDSTQARIASITDLTKQQVKRWFDKRRHKLNQVKLHYFHFRQSNERSSP